MYVYSNSSPSSQWDNLLSQADNPSSDYSFIIRMDGSFSSENQVAGIGWTINNQLELIAAGAATIRANSSLQAELLASATSVEEIISRILKHYVIFTDSVILYNFIRGMTSAPDDIAGFIKFCAETISQSTRTVV